MTTTDSHPNANRSGLNKPNPVNKIPMDGQKMTQEIRNLHLLAGLVRCQPCGTEMTATQDPDNRYVCPTLMESGPDDCTTPQIDTAYLDRLVVSRMVENLLTSKNLQAVIKMAQEQSGKMALQHQAELETISDRLAGQNRPRRELMAAVETKKTTFAEVAGRVQELNDTKAKLEAQAMEAKKQLEIQEFVSDETRIRENARNINTYLGAVNKKTVREMIRTLIQEVLVRPGTATLRYTIPMPSSEPGKEAMTEEVALG